MFLKLSHTNLDVYKCSKDLVLSSYKLTRLFPDHERYIMVQQIRRAALSIHLNLAEGFSRKSIKERKRYFEVARGSVVEIDAAIGIAFDLTYFTMQQVDIIGQQIIRTYQMLSGLIGGGD